MLLRHAIGSVLRHLRLERGKTLRELSEASRISLPYLSEVERGRKEASSEILASLCRVLDVSEPELLSRVAAEFARREVTVAATVFELPRSVGPLLDATSDAAQPSDTVSLARRTSAPQLLAA